MEALADSAVFWLVLILALIAGYFLPTWIALGRRVDGLLSVVSLNLIGLIGWPFALALACGLPRRQGSFPPPQWPSPPPHWSAPAPGGSPGTVIVMTPDQRDPDSFSATRLP